MPLIFYNTPKCFSAFIMPSSSTEGRYIVCGGFYLIRSIAHCYANTGMSEHRNIIPSISKSHCIFQVDTIIFQHVIYPPYSYCCHVL